MDNMEYMIVMCHAFVAGIFECGKTFNIPQTVNLICSESEYQQKVSTPCLYEQCISLLAINL